MAISRFAASRVTQGLPKYQSAWDQDSVAAGALVPIQSVTLGSATDLSFGSIPQIYQDLVLVMSFTKLSGTFDIIYALNGDYASNSAGRVMLFANNSGIGFDSRTNDSTIYPQDGQANSLGYPCTSIVTLFDYTNTNRKTVLIESGHNKSSYVFKGLTCSSKTIGAVTFINVSANDGSGFAPGSTFTLYGIKGE